jgi:hypothetical protein
MQRCTQKAREEFVGLIVMHAAGPTGIGSQDEHARIQRRSAATVAGS